MPLQQNTMTFLGEEGNSKMKMPADHLTLQQIRHPLTLMHVHADRHTCLGKAICLQQWLSLQRYCGELMRKTIHASGKTIIQTLYMTIHLYCIPLALMPWC